MRSQFPGPGTVWLESAFESPPYVSSYHDVKTIFLLAVPSDFKTPWQSNVPLPHSTGNFTIVPGTMLSVCPEGTVTSPRIAITFDVYPAGYEPPSTPYNVASAIRMPSNVLPELTLLI